MADDEDDVRGAPGPEELLAPAGPRRSNFTPATPDADSLEAASNVFNDDAIAAALAAELARVASGPIPIQPGPAAPVAEGVAAAAAPEPEIPAASAEPASDTSGPETVEPAAAPVSAEAPSSAEPPAPTADAPTVPSVPTPPPAPAKAESVAPQGPPDWASPLFGQPTVPAHDAAPAPSLEDPFAPNAPSFAPATGSFPPPNAYPESDPSSAAGDPASVDPDSLRELYRGAPAPTVPAADAPPPPGYEQPSATLSAIEELQARLHLREQEAQEFAAWESAMQAIGTPEALAEVARARADLAGTPSVPSAPEAPADEPVFDLAPPAEEPAASFAPPLNEPVATFAPPVEEPVASFAPPAEEPAVDLAPPVEEPQTNFAAPADEPFLTLAPPSDEPAPGFTPPADEPFATLAPPPDEAAFDFAPPAEEPAVDFAPPAEEPAANLAPPVDDPYAAFAPPPDEESPFAGFAAPAEASTPDTFAPPADPRDLSFVPPPAIPDAPAFLEPPALVEPPPTDGVEALYRSAAEPPSFEFPTPTEAAPEGPIQPPASAVPDAAPAAPSGFDDLLAGSGEPSPPAASSAFTAPDPPAAPDSTEDPEGRRPFGEGVERDDAVDPSDSIFGKAPGPVSVNTAGVAVVPEYVSVDSTPIRVQPPPLVGTTAPPVELKSPTITPAEPVGSQPTALEQRVGRSVRLFWMWFAANSSIVAIIFGAIIFALGVSLRQAIVGTLAGVALSFFPLGLGTLAGKRSGQPTMIVSRATFGVMGNILPAILALLSRLFWAAALLWILGEGTTDILIGAQLTDGFSTGELTIIAMSLVFVVATVIAFFGYALIAKVQLMVSIISAVAIAGFIALTWHYVNIGTALTQPDGPWILAITAAVLVFSFVGLAWANTGADVARYQRTGSSGAASVLWASFGAALPTFVLIGYGSLLAASNPTIAQDIAANPLDTLGRILPVWYPVPLLAATVLSLMSAIVLSMYSGGFALQAAGLRLRRPLATLLVAVLVIVIALFLSVSVTNFEQLIRDVSTTVAVPIGAWIGIFGAEVMIRKAPLDADSLLKRGGRYPDVRWMNIIALVAVTAIGYGFLSATASGLSWEGYGFTAFGIPLTSPIATSDLGVLVALLLGLVISAAAGGSAIRKQEKAEQAPE